MIFPENLESKLGFDQIRDRLRSYCYSQAGASWVDRMRFSAESDFIKILLRQSLELKAVFEKGENFPTQHFYDGEDWLKRIGLSGSYLEGEEFLKLAQALETVLACKNFLTKSKEQYPQLFKLAEPLTLTSQVPQLITSKIDDRGLVRDAASSVLAKIRKSLRDEQSRARRLADQLFRHAVEQKFVPEGALPTIREGRVVIPILAEHKRKVKGFILDESATGQTVFMEPAEMLDANNEIRDLEHAEKREVIKVLRELTDVLREQLPVLKLSFQLLAQLDFIRAKAKFAIDIHADMPIVESKPEMVWYTAKHPLLYLSLKGKREVVPLNITLEPDKRLLLVSGPNAGGKSVTLKTVGLLQYMVQCGLLIPLSDRSRVGVFQDIFLDIGDQQSIENDLSTYSSHLKNMAAFIQHAGDRSLVLMDELGSGTDPNFGGAIAQAVLEALLKRRVWGVATTHYYNLKLFAGQRQGVVNAAMRFDDKNLVPLYMLDIGKPGSSFALEIARKTGLPQQTLADAENLVGKDLAGFETLVRSLERERQELTEKLRRVEQQETSMRVTLQRYQSLSSELENRKKEIISKAKEEASELLRQTNREIEKTIRHIRENKAERKETQKVRKGLESLGERVAPIKIVKEKVPESIEEGDRVRIIGQEGSGIVLSLKGKHASVQFGDLKTMIKLERLEKISGAVAKEISRKLQSVGINIYEKQASFNAQLDVRGMRVDEVVPMLDQFLDTAILLGHGEVRVLHGKGEGVLRKVIREQLKKYKQVASVSDEHVERGGDGISIIILK